MAYGIIISLFDTNYIHLRKRAKMDVGSKVVMNWSSGKDAALAYHLLLQQNKFKVSHLLTTLSREHSRVFMHGVREILLDAQAARMNLPLVKVSLPSSPDDLLYKKAMTEILSGLKKDGVVAAAYGDIFLDDLRQYREDQLSQIGLQSLFPLWKMNTRELVRMVEDAGIEAIIVCVSEKHLGKEFLGQKINADLLSSLPANVDPCGENGEFHTFVYNAPFFSEPIPIATGEIVYKNYDAVTSGQAWDTGFYFLDVNLKEV
jgi:uncharacterized protein (TIGR00290 family)